MGLRDFEDIFALEPIGLRHRLVHCIRQAAYMPAAQLLSTDFDQARHHLEEWLSQQADVSEEHRQLLVQACFDNVTCSDLTASDLGLAGIPLAARKRLLLLLHSLPPLTARSAKGGANSSDVEWSTQLQKTVLEHVLQENKALAQRLQQVRRQHTTAPDEYLCPITCELMEDPVMTEDGQTYEREAIVTWVTSAGTSPMTRQRMANMFIPNRGLKAAIERWQRQQVDLP
jgi:hypothetical protein